MNPGTLFEQIGYYMRNFNALRSVINEKMIFKGTCNVNPNKTVCTSSHLWSKLFHLN